MPDPLAQDLARALDLHPSEAERAVSHLVRHLRHQLQETGQVRIEGLGTFREDGDTLAFEPEPGLRQAVNHRYAGLPAVPAGPSSRPEPLPPSETPLEPVDPFADAVPATPPLHVPPPPDEPPIRDLTSDEPAPEAEPPTGVVEAEATFEPEEAFQATEPPEAEEVPETTEPSDAVEIGEAAPSEEPEAEEPEIEEPEIEEPAVEEPATEEPDVEEPELEAPRFEQPPEVEAQQPPEAEAPEPDPISTERATEDELNALLEGIWTPRSGPADEDHPLGPMPPELMEDADYSVLGEEDVPPPSDPLPELPLPPPPPPPVEPPAAPPPPPEQAPAVAATAAPPPRSIRDAHGRATERTRSRLPLVLAAFVVLLLALVALVWVLSGRLEEEDLAAGDLAPSDTVAAVPPTLAEPDTAALVAADTLAGAPGEPGIAGALPPEPTAPEADPSTPEEQPLLSTGGIDPARGGYTWVIASEASRAAADRTAARYREQGFRADVLPSTLNGQTRYRVAIGQFQTAEDANRFRDQLPASVPAGTWLLRL